MVFTELVSLKSKGEARAWEEKRKSQTAAEGARTHPKAGRLVLLRMAPACEGRTLENFVLKPIRNME